MQGFDPVVVGVVEALGQQLLHVGFERLLWLYALQEGRGKAQLELLLVSCTLLIKQFKCKGSAGTSTKTKGTLPGLELLGWDTNVADYLNTKCCLGLHSIGIRRTFTLDYDTIDLLANIEKQRVLPTVSAELH